MEIRSFPVVGGYIKRIEKNILDFGFQECLRQEISRSKTRFEVIGMDENLKTILQKSPVILAFNHPYETETFACLSALPDRQDYFFIATAYLKNVIPKIDEHLIPVFILKRKDMGIMRKLFDLALKRFPEKNGLSDNEKHTANIENIKRASEIVKSGGLVAINPNPHQKKWFSGVGWLISNTGPMENGYYVKVYVRGSSNLDYLRLIPGAGKFLPKISIYFSEPKRLSGVWEKDGKVLASKLEEEYASWEKGLT